MYPDILPPSSSSWFRNVLSQRCNVVLVNNRLTPLPWTRLFSPWTYVNFKYSEFPMGRISTAYPHTRLKTAPLCSLCACQVSTSFGGPLFLRWKRWGALGPPGLRSSPWKDLNLAADACTSVGNPLSPHASYSSLRHMSRGITGQHLICAISLKKGLGERFGNKHLPEDWGFLFCLTGCALTLFFSRLVMPRDDSCKWRAAELK